MGAYKLEPGENIIIILRRHWFTFLMISLRNIFLFLAPFAVIEIIKLITTSTQIIVGFPTIPASLTLFLVSGWAWIIWTRFFISWTDHHLDAWIITNKRIIDIDQHGFFNRQISSARMDRIQDISVTINGFIPTLLDFGDITVQTAGENTPFLIRQIPHPKRQENLINKYHSNLIETDFNDDEHSGVDD